MVKKGKGNDRGENNPENKFWLRLCLHYRITSLPAPDVAEIHDVSGF